MLLQFSVGNYRSFREPKVLSLVAAPREELHPSHLIGGIRGADRGVLRCSAIYGANASGKSNLVRALEAARDLILAGTRGDDPIPVEPFRLGPTGPAEPSAFELVFTAGDVLYAYGFEVHADRVQSEYLYGTFTSRRAMLFDRTTDESGVVKVELGERFIRGTTRRGVARYVAEGTRPNQLFLTEAADRNIGAAVAAIRFFRTGLLVIGAEAEYVPLEDRASADSDFVTFLSRQLRAMGTGVDEVRAERSDAALQGFLAGLTADDRTQLTEQVRQLKPGGGMQIRGPLGRMVLTKADTGEMVALILQAKHTTGAGDSVVFDLKDESDGTIRLVHLLPAWFELLRGNDVTVVVDELDRRLHPMLVRHLVRLWLECPREAGRGQLVFTTHDTGLLCLDLLRRDEVWFTEKDALGATDLYSLVEFRPRTGPGLEKGYLMGRFGAIPYLGDLHDGCPDAGVPAASETIV